MSASFRYLIVAGTFSSEGPGKPSGLMGKLHQQMSIINPWTLLFNGATIEDLDRFVDHPDAFDEFDVIIWSPVLPEGKNYDIKKRLFRKIFIPSFNNTEGQYPFINMLSEALGQKANLFLEFSKYDYDTTKYQVAVCDPLGNMFCRSADLGVVAMTLMYRIQELTRYTRVSSICVEDSYISPEMPENYLHIVRKLGERFHEIIHMSESYRYLGNLSFRCAEGFPSFKDGGGRIYVSRRDSDKRSITDKQFIPVSMAAGGALSGFQVRYRGHHKPSVDAPIQMLLYNYYRRIKFIIHGHAYINSAPFTSLVIPCGALEEFYEVIKVYPDRDMEFFEVNLKGHGSIAFAKDVEQLRKIRPYYKRPLPEEQH